MIKYKMSGRIFPQHHKLTLHPFKGIPVDLEDYDLHMVFDIWVVNSIIDVECTINRLNRKDHAKAQTQALRLIESAVNLVSFKYGIFLFAIIESVTLPDDSKKDIQYSIDGLGELCTSFEHNKYVPVKEVASTNLKYVLRDLIGALEPDMMTINCARAMDGIRNLIADPGVREKVAWEQMRAKLRIDEAYLKYVSELSKDHRHARYVPMFLEDTVPIIRRAWTVMDRYLHFILRGGVDPLPEDEFPLLKE